MGSYIDPGEQLVVALYVRDIKTSSEFYGNFGFEIIRDEGTFMELRFEESYLFLVERSDAPEPGSPSVGNIRLMVPDVDDYWNLAKKVGAVVVQPLEERYYGLRDFTVAGPGGLGLRFAAKI